MPRGCSRFFQHAKPDDTRYALAHQPVPSGGSLAFGRWRCRGQASRLPLVPARGRAEAPRSRAAVGFQRPNASALPPVRPEGLRRPAAVQSRLGTFRLLRPLRQFVAAASLDKGACVIVTGRFRQRSFTTGDGDPQRAVEPRRRRDAAESGAIPPVPEKREPSPEVRRPARFDPAI